MAPDSAAVRVALWRAMHVQIDVPPHVFDDEIGLQLAAPGNDWRDRGDMHSGGTCMFRASMVARARFVEDLVIEQADQGVTQYVFLGAGLVPDWLHLVPVDFEAGDSWWDRIAEAGFDAHAPAVIASTGVSMYLTKEANAATLRQIAALAPGSTLAMSFLLPPELLDADEGAGLQGARQGAQSSGTPFISVFAPDELLELARDAGFKTAEIVAAPTLNDRYFAARPDGLRTTNAEQLLVAHT